MFSPHSMRETPARDSQAGRREFAGGRGPFAASLTLRPPLPKSKERAISTQPPPQIGSEQARRDSLEECVDRILRSEGVGPFREHASELISRTFNPETSSSELTRVILKDLGLASQILRVANSALYNRSGRQILGIPYAVTLLGVETIRGVTMALRYIDHFANRSPAVRELMLLAVLNAIHTREAASRLGYRRLEEAYLRGLFRSLGEVLVACHYPEEYSRIVLAMHAERLPLSAACARVLGFTSDVVGARVSEAWNMPAGARPGVRGEGPAEPAARRLTQCADFCFELTDAVYRRGASAGSIRPRFLPCADGGAALLSLQDLGNILDSGAKESAKTFAALRIALEGLRLDRQAAAARLFLAEALANAPVFHAERLARLLQTTEAAGRELQGGHLDAAPFISRLLDALREAGFERVVFALVNEERTWLRGRLASAPDPSVDALLNAFQFRLDCWDGLLREACRNVDALVDCAHETRYAGSQLMAAFKPQAFALFPVVFDGKLAACLYADRHSPTNGLENIRPGLERVRELIAAALRMRARAAALGRASPNAETAAAKPSLR